MPDVAGSLSTDCEAVGVSPERLSRALALLDGWVAQGKVPGVAAVVVRRGKVLARHFRGCAAPGDEDRPIGPGTIFPLASISKAITALAFMTLVESGDVVLDDPVATFVPDFAKNGKEGMRVRHLLTHTSGLPDMPTNNESLRKAHSGLASFVRAAARADLAFNPGTRVSYSSMGTLMLGEIAERLTKQRFADCATERVFAPLGMASTGFCPAETLYPRIALLRPMEGRKPTNWDNNSPYWRQLGAPWGGAFATIDDVARLGSFVLGLCGPAIPAGSSGILSPSTVRLMTQSQTRGIPNVGGWQESWGLGWALPSGHPTRFAGDLCSPETFGHRGAAGSLIWIDPVRELVCVVLSNQLTNWGTDSRRFAAFSNAVQGAVVR